jgi:uncharacterized BrkB/YihY/UPF0761 family membrane protein
MEMDVSLLKKPSATVPIAISFAALTLVVVHHSLIISGDDSDVGGFSRAFRIILALQIPLVIYFLYRWLPRKPNEALRVLALQAGAALVAIAAGMFF